MPENCPDLQIRVGLRPRLVAAGWFALAALAPVIYFFAVFGRGTRLLTGSWSDAAEVLTGIGLFGVVPVSAAAFWGFTLGARLADIRNRPGPVRAAVTGVFVALLSYVSFMACFGFVVQLGPLLSSDNQSSQGGYEWFFFIFIIGFIFVGWLILLAGAIAGALLPEVARWRHLGNGFEKI